MRWSFERLSGVVSQGMQREPLSGDLYVFLNRKRDSMKVLYFEPSGYCIWYKRLEAGRFSILEKEEITSTELLCLLDGLEINEIMRKKRFFLRKSSAENATA